MINMFIGVLLGMVAGGIVGIIVTSLCVISGEADDRMGCDKDA